MLYESLRTRLLPLPDGTLVYPAHGAGSLCGRSLSTETVSTIGEQRRANYALQPMSAREFVGLVTADQPDAPPYFAYDASLNARERPTLEAGSINIGLSGPYATWAGTVLACERPIAIVAELDGSRRPPPGWDGSGSTTSPGISPAAYRCSRPVSISCVRAAGALP